MNLRDCQEGFSSSCRHRHQEIALAGNERILHGMDALSLIGAKPPNAFRRCFAEPIMRRLRIFRKSARERIGAVKILERARCSFRSTGIQVPDECSVACIEERNAQPIPLANSRKYATRVAPGLLQDVLRIDRYLFRFDDRQ